MYQLAASAALSIYGAAMTAKAQAEQATADNIAAQEKRRLEFNRDQQAYLMNMNAAAKQSTADNFNISLAAAEAQDQLDLAKAGSGLAGSSINELDDEISRSVGADRVSAQRSLIDSQDKLNQNRITNNENRLFQANQARSQDFTKGISNALIGAAAPLVGKAFDNAYSNPAEKNKDLSIEERKRTTKNWQYSSDTQSIYGAGAFIS